MANDDGRRSGDAFTYLESTCTAGGLDGRATESVMTPLSGQAVYINDTRRLQP